MYFEGRLPAARVYRGWLRNIDPDHARAAMVASYQVVTDDVGKLDEDELARPSGCRGWSRGDLLLHMLLDAQRTLVTFATPASGEADVDFISYRTPFRPGAEGTPRTPGSSGGWLRPTGRIWS
jgi:hypothetical protein